MRFKAGEVGELPVRCGLPTLSLARVKGSLRHLFICMLWWFGLNGWGHASSSDNAWCMVAPPIFWAGLLRLGLGFKCEWI
ncbi:hypothetical protein GOP47_0008221 [Adiantum capillus-veneris]|uniref:Uncharacterized protein n=1 Tax=Adiantum capillus-veneris TaxID=13818 RepID=A0A9D4UY13_ADICA|nr:hypothetical protein GOP47_0008221 [Adiantum capillus-veneris]